MSWITKVLVVFPAIAGVSTYPLTLAIQSKVTDIKEIAEVVPPPVTSVPAKVSAKELMKQIIVTKQYEGCAELRNTVSGGSLWFVCSSKNNSNKPSLYNYNRTRRDSQFIVAEATSINPSKREITLSTGTTEKFRIPPSWLHQFRNQNLTPNNDCSVTEDGQGSGGQKSYTLKCHEKEVQKGIQFEITRNN